MKRYILKANFAFILAVWFACSFGISNAYAGTLGWSSHQQAVWQQMYTENHPLWQDLKTKADDPDVYDDNGLYDAMVYMITKDVNYAQSAWDTFDYWAGRTKPGSEPANRNVTRQRFAIMSLMYEWISPALATQQKKDFRDILDHWADLCFNMPNPETGYFRSYGTRTCDSDETVGHYFGVVFYALAIADEDPARSSELLNMDPPVGQDGFDVNPVGGVDATGANLSTWRNALAYYAERADGGQWMESSDYNLNTVQLVLMGIEGVNSYYEEDKFPELTALYDDFVQAYINEVSPTLEDLFQWGDTQSPHDTGLYRRVGLMSMVSGLTKDPEALYLYDYFRSAFKPRVPEAMAFLHADPYSSRSTVQGQRSHYANGRGISYYHQEWNADDSFFGSLIANAIGLDHERESLSNFNLMKNTEWVINNPKAYYGGAIEAPYMNTLMISGGLSSCKEARGSSAYEAGEKFLYHVGLTGGRFVREGYWDPPPVSINEWTRTHLYLKHENGSDSIVVFDRVDAVDPRTLNGFSRYPQMNQNRVNDADGKHQWIIHLPDDNPVFNGDTVTWQTDAGQDVSLTTFMSSSYDRQLYDEEVLYNSGKLSGYIYMDQLKYQLRIIPSERSGFQSFLNVIHSGSNIAIDQLLSYSGEQAQGALLQTGSESIVVIFNATEGDDLPSTPTSGGVCQFDPQKFSDIDQLRFFEASFEMNIDIDGLTKVFLMDLDPTKAWKVDIDGSESDLTVSAQGLTQFVLDGAGVQKIKVFSEAGANRPPVAVIKVDSIDDLTVYFNGSQSSDPDGDDLSYSWSFGDTQTSNEMNPVHVYPQADEYTVSLTVSDGNLTDTDTTTVSVGLGNRAPELDTIGDQTVEEGEDVVINVSASDPDGDSIDLSVELSNGDPISTIGATFVDYGNGTGVFNWVPLSQHVDNQYVLVFKVTDGSLWDMESVILTVVAEATAEEHWLETEYPDSIYNPMVDENSFSASQSKFIYSPSGSNSGYSTYTINITQAGEYVLWGRVIAPNYQDDSFFIQMDNGTDNLWDVPIGADWHWAKVSHRGGANPVKFNLNAGSHTITVKVREDGTKIDKMLLTNDLHYTPAGIGKEAENLPASGPEASNDSAIIDEDSGANTVDVLANDVGDSLVITDVTQGAKGTVVITNGGKDLAYTPNANYFGTDSFTYTIKDGNDGFDTATVTVTVNNVNDDPSALDDMANIDEDSGSNTIDVLANDTDAPDVGETLLVDSVTQGAHGAVAITNGGQNLAYTPDDNYYGTDSFTYIVVDGNGGSDTAVVTVIINSVNDDPSASDDTATVDEDSLDNAIDVLANDTDAPDTGETILIDSVTQGAHGIVLITNGGQDLTYTPDPGYSGPDNFTYTITDGNGGYDTAQVDVTVEEKGNEEESHWLETEYADSITSPMQEANDGSASEGKYIYSPKGNNKGEATYTVTISEAGEYILWGRVIAPNSRDDSFYIQIDNGTNNLWDVPIGSQWHWSKVSNRGGANPVKFTLSAGVHTIKIKVREDGAKIDKILLTNDLDYVPNGQGEPAENIPSGPSYEDHWLETEYYDTIVSPMQVANDNNASLGQYVYSPQGGNSGYTAYTVTISEAGEYVLWGRVIAPNSRDDSFYIQIDNGSDKLWDVPIGSQWHWSKVSDRGKANPVKFTLSAGVHTIKVKVREDGAKIDKLLLTNDMGLTPSGQGEPAENVY